MAPLTEVNTGITPKDKPVTDPYKLWDTALGFEYISRPCIEHDAVEEPAATAGQIKLETAAFSADGNIVSEMPPVDPIDVEA